MIDLRPYQSDAVAGLRSAFTRVPNPLLVLPTGGGKTVIFSYLAQRLTSRNVRVMILAHRDELLEQIHAALKRFGVLAQVVSGGMGYDSRYLCHVASVQTIIRRLDKIAIPDYLIIDEAHHVTPDTVWGKVIAGLRERNPSLRILGVTATPCRLSGEGLGQSFGEMVIGPTPADLIADGWLSRYRMFGPPPGEGVDMSSARTVAGDYNKSDVVAAVDRPVIHGSAVAHYRRHCSGAPGLAFCPSVEAANHTADAFKEAGFSAMAIDGKMDRATRRRAVADFGSGQLQILTSCALVSEGFDVPAIVAAFMLNPTQSLSKCLQEYGRALRPSPGKDAALIFDHAGNSSRHGFPDDEREWSLEGTKRRKKSDVQDVPMKQCPQCYACCRPIAQYCPECNFKFVTVARKIETRDGDLAELARPAAKPKIDIERARADSFDALLKIEKERGYKPGWANHVMLARAQKKGKPDDTSDRNASHPAGAGFI